VHCPSDIVTRQVLVEWSLRLFPTANQSQKSIVPDCALSPKSWLEVAGEVSTGEVTPQDNDRSDVNCRADKIV
jgi:hypothetical protein